MRAERAASNLSNKDFLIKSGGTDTTYYTAIDADAAEAGGGGCVGGSTASARAVTATDTQRPRLETTARATLKQKKELRILLRTHAQRPIKECLADKHTEGPLIIAGNKTLLKTLDSLTYTDLKFIGFEQHDLDAVFGIEQSHNSHTLTFRVGSSIQRIDTDEVRDAEHFSQLILTQNGKYLPYVEYFRKPLVDGDDGEVDTKKYPNSKVTSYLHCEGTDSTLEETPDTQGAAADAAAASAGL